MKAASLITAIAVFVIVLDQLSKLVVLASVGPGEVITVIPKFFNLTLTFNKGAAFGFLAGAPDGMRQVLLYLMTAVALGVVVLMLVRDYRHSSLAKVALAMIIGGALGNIIDRIRIGHVVDFLDAYYGTYHWPAFNLADSSICIGVFLLLLFARSKPKQNEAPSA
jgi:signal peptidase II